MKKYIAMASLLLLAASLYLASYATLHLEKIGPTTERDSYRIFILGIKFQNTESLARVLGFTYWPLREITSDKTETHVSASNVYFHKDLSLISIVTTDAKNIGMTVPESLVPTAKKYSGDGFFQVTYKLTPDLDNPFSSSYELTSLEKD